MVDLVGLIDEKCYPGSGRNWDDVLFREHICRHITERSTVLDLGAGVGVVAQMNFKGMAARVCGIDLDGRVLSNPCLDEARVAAGEDIPYPDGTFDVIFADNVLEHLSQPGEIFSEVSRLLAPGGVFCAKTPNRWHYMPVIASLTPHWFHVRVNKWRGRSDVDIFPTLYRANTDTRIRELAAAAGLEVRSIDCIEGRPEYLRQSAFTYIFGVLYERLVNSLAFLARFRILLIMELSKPGS